MTIIKGISIPKSKVGKWERTHKYEYTQLEVGDCFKVEGRDAGYSAACCARAWGKTRGRDFIARLLEGDVVGVFRVV